MADLRRVYVHEEIYKKLRSAKDRYDESMAELSREAIGSYFDEKGRRKEARLSEETHNRIRNISESTGRSPDEIVNGLADTVQTLFSPTLSFSDMIRSIPDIAEDMVEKERERAEEAENEREVDWQMEESTRSEKCEEVF